MSTQPPTTLPRRSRRLLWVLGAGVVVAAGVGGLTWWSFRHDRERTDALEAARANFTQAEPALATAYDRDSNDAEVVEALARGYQAADDLRAERFLNRWVELRPNQSEPLRLRMEFYRKRKDERAFADARRLLELSPDDFQLRRTAMNHAFSFGYFAEAEDLCRGCLRAQPNDPGLIIMLAEIRRARGDAAEAARHFDEALKLQPQSVPALLGRGNLYLEAGEPDKAVPLLQKAYDLDPARRRITGYQLAVALERTGRPGEAEKIKAEVRRRQDTEVFRDAMLNQPDNLDLKVRFAVHLLDDGHTQDGLELLQTVLTRDPGFIPAHRALAAHYDKTNQPDLAARHRRLAGDAR